MWQRLLPAYYQKPTGSEGRGHGGEGRPPRPSTSNPRKDQQPQKHLLKMKLGRRPWRSRTNKADPRNTHDNSNSNSNSTGKSNSTSNSDNAHNQNKKETDTIARLLSLERHLGTDSDELCYWTAYDEEDDDESPMPLTADDIEQALARFDTALQDMTKATNDTMIVAPVRSTASRKNSLQDDNIRECSITMIGPNSLVDHNPISALSIYTDGGNTDTHYLEMDNTDETINTMASALDNTVTTHNTMPSLVDHSISTSNSMPSLLDHTVTTTNTLPSLLDNTVTTVNTMPSSMLDNSVTTLGYDDDDHDDQEVNEIDMTTMDMSMDLDVDLDMAVSTSGDAAGDEDTIAKAVNAVLKDHHNRDSIVPAARRRESSLLVARRDSCSTISTAPDTPESPLVISEYLVESDSSPGDFITMTTTNPTTTIITAKNPTLNETCHCPLPKCPRCSRIVWPLEFFFVNTAPLFPSNLPRIRKSKKFLPDPLTVGDFYGDDDEDIRFVPQVFEQETSSTTRTTTTTTTQRGDEEIVLGLAPPHASHNNNHLDKPQGKSNDPQDKDNDGTSTISTWTDDPETGDDDDDDDEEDEMDSQIKSYSHRSGSTDIASQMTADRTPKVQNKCNSNRRLFCDQDGDEWKENVGVLRMGDLEERSNKILGRYPHAKSHDGTQHVLAPSNNVRKTMMHLPPPMQAKPNRTTSSTESLLLAKFVRSSYTPPMNPTAPEPRRNRLWRCPSKGLDGILPPLRHNLSFMVPPPPPPPSPPPPPLSRTSHMSGTKKFQSKRIEI